LLNSPRALLVAMLIPISRATPRNTAVIVRMVRARRFGKFREAIFAESDPSTC